MNIVLWVIAALLAVVFLAAGTSKLTKAPQDLVDSGMEWAGSWNPAAIKALGALQVLAAIGLIVPPLVGIAPILAAFAATGLALVMGGAVVIHVQRKEYPHIGINVVLLILAAVVAWGRFGPYAF